MPNFYQTGGSKGNTIIEASYGSGRFKVLWRAKDKGARLRIGNIAQLCVGKGINYVWGGTGVYNAFKSGKNSYNTNVKIAKTKLKNKGTDCSGFASACAKAGGSSMGIQHSATMVNTSSFTNFTKHKAQKVFAAGTYQRGDIVAYVGDPGHAAVVAHNGPNVPKDTFKNYKSDGSKIIKNKKTEKIRKHIKNYKTDLKTKKKKSKQALKNYLAKMKAERKTIKAKYKKWKNKKNKTEAQKAYTKKLKNALNKLNKDVIPSIEKAIRDYKEPKSRPKTQNTSNTAANNYTNWDEGTDNDNKNNTEIDTNNAEPVITPEKVDWYYIRSGLNYFSEEEIYDSQNQKVRHKDYMGKIYCKRKLKIPMINVTKNYWDFSFDMPFTSCSSYPASIKSAAMVGGDTTKWRYYLNTNGMGQIQGGIYTIMMKTSSGIEYEIRCEIETYYDV